MKEKARADSKSGASDPPQNGEEGAASRLEQWRKQGKAERSVEIARALLGKLPVETISETTGLSIEEIEQLS